MMKVLKIAGIALLVLILAACRGENTTPDTPAPTSPVADSGTGSSDDPVARAQGFMNALAALDVETMQNFLCAAQADQAASIAQGLAASDTGITIDASGLTYAAETSEEDTLVNVTGDLKVTTAGQTTEMPVDLMFEDGNLPMIQENGVWKVCPPAIES